MTMALFVFAALFLATGFVAAYLFVLFTFALALVCLVKGLGRPIVEGAAAAEAPARAEAPVIPIVRVVKEAPASRHLLYRRILFDIAMKEAELQEVERRILLAHAEARKLGLEADLAAATAADRARAGDILADLWLLRVDKAEFEDDPDVIKLDALDGHPMR